MLGQDRPGLGRRSVPGRASRPRCTRRPRAEGCPRGGARGGWRGRRRRSGRRRGRTARWPRAAWASSGTAIAELRAGQPSTVPGSTRSIRVRPGTTTRRPPRTPGAGAGRHRRPRERCPRPRPGCGTWASPGCGAVLRAGRREGATAVDGRGAQLDDARNPLRGALPRRAPSCHGRRRPRWPRHRRRSARRSGSGRRRQPHTPRKDAGSVDRPVRREHRHGPAGRSWVGDPAGGDPPGADRRRAEDCDGT